MTDTPEQAAPGHGARAEEHAHGSHAHGHEGHEREQHGHEHAHGHEPHEHAHAGHGEGGPAPEPGAPGDRVITVRALSGLSGDMMLSGLSGLAGLEETGLDALIDELGLPALAGSVRLAPRFVNHIAGLGCAVTLPHEHAHRTFADITAIIERSAMPGKAKALACEAFSLLAEAEAAVHGKAKADVAFHEVGALDSILDICLASRIFTLLSPARFVCSPLPLADGAVFCAHGHIPSPAPAVLRMLENVPVCAFPGRGETVTPTALALLKAFKADFGGWPAMVVRKTVISYGSKVFADAPNGAVWALGTAWKAAADAARRGEEERQGAE